MLLWQYRPEEKLPEIAARCREAINYSSRATDRVTKVTLRDPTFKIDQDLVDKHKSEMKDQDTKIATILGDHEYEHSDW